MRNPSTKVKSMKIRFITLVEKKITTIFKILLPFCDDSICRTVFVSHCKTIMGSGSLKFLFRQIAPSHSESAELLED